MIKVLVAGDFCERFRVAECIKEGNYSLMFDDIKTIICQADYSIVNLEFPIIKEAEAPISKSGPNLKGTLGSIDALKYAGFNVCTLANNHILDQGEDNCLFTKQQLEEAAIKTVGVGVNKIDAEGPLYVNKEEETLAIINCCEHEFSIARENSAGANPLNPTRQYYTIREAKNIADHVIVIVHGGHEHFQLPSPRMKETYRFFIDCGADAVINHHQHCFSGYELYRGRPIFYGLGNFMFDEPHSRNTIWNEGFMVSLKLEPGRIPSFELIPYYQCNETPSVKRLSSEQNTSFDRRIKELSSIIEDDNSLMESYNVWLNNTKKEYELIIEPYNDRLTMGLYRRRLLPSLVCKKQKVLLYNFIACESHRDRLLDMLFRVINK